MSQKFELGVCQPVGIIRKQCIKYAIDCSLVCWSSNPDCHIDGIVSIHMVQSAKAARIRTQERAPLWKEVRSYFSLGE